MNTLIDQLRLVHLEGRETNFFRKLSAHDLLIIDDFGMVRLEGQIQHDFEQIIDDRYNRRALILTSQLPVADWYNVFQSELIAEACLDRLVHKSKRLALLRHVTDFWPILAGAVCSAHPCYSQRTLL